MHKILDFNVPTKMSASNTFLPWITTQTKRLIKKIRKLGISEQRKEALPGPGVNIKK